MKNPKPIYILLLIGIIAVGGYGVMQVMVYLFPMPEGGMFVHVLVTSLIIALGLGIPYWILKLAVYKARLEDGREKEVKFRNIPKDEERVEQKNPPRKAGGRPKPVI